MLPRRSPRFRKTATPDPLRNSSSQSSKDVPNSVNVNEDFRPLLWQSRIPGLSENEISFPIPQPGPSPSTAFHDQSPRSACSDGAITPREGSQAAIGANWKAVLRR